MIFFPRGKEEVMRWVSLFGTALTLGVSIGMFILFYNNVIDDNRPCDRAGREPRMGDPRLAAPDNISAGKIEDPQKATAIG